MGSITDLLLVSLIVISIFWILLNAGKYAGFSPESMLQGSQYTQPFVPVVDFFKQLSGKVITVEIGLLALVLIFILLMFRG